MKDLKMKNSLKSIIGLLFLIAVAYSCKDLASFNNNPNEPKSANTSYLLTSAEKGLADNYYLGVHLGYFGNYYAQYWSANQYASESRYNYRTNWVNDIWDGYYTNLNTLQQIIRQNRAEESSSPQNANQIAVAKILKAWTFQTLTDIWGDIPFTESLSGSDVPSPSYTSQEEVYSGIIAMLTEASDSIQVGEPSFDSGDIFYGGDMAKWKKFANSLKMRAAIRIADVNPELAETTLQNAYSAGVMESTDDNALFAYQSSPPNNNPINDFYRERTDWAVSETLLSFMLSNEDPRIPIYANPASNVPDGTTVYSGFPYGMTNSNAANYKNGEPWSAPGDRVRDAEDPAIFMLYSEVLFIEAEAAERGWLPVDPAQSYQQAIMASMEYWGVSDDNAQSYVANNPYQPANWQENIGRQKWVSLYMQGVQGWAEWRRLNFGLLIEPVGGKLSVSFDGPIAIRYPYPTGEYDTNSENVNAAVENQGFSTDDQGQRVWWDVAPNTAAN
jgi:hypothetical protein